ncbi:MAG TPA: cobalt-precorrin-5B (C(1))-methyltransferase [Chloroflexota bacterium]|nr:cobalt-precorrin-5B (C(1))-methyltransferase [Chloroflexota bacterium]
MDDDAILTPVRRRKLRRGYTTGSCATAAAAAATRALLAQQPVEEVTIHLPAGSDATFRLERCRFGATGAECAVIKDAGDDPDVTHLAEVVARVTMRDEPGLELAGGVGVGTVTRPGLGLLVGGPAINPVPRRMITEHVSAVATGRLNGRGLRVEIAMPRGEELAKRTLNGRLGIVGGLSILGTSGLVIPYSTAAWRASVEQGVDVAAANGVTHVVLSTGSRSEQYAQALFDLPEMAFVEMGEFTGHALKRCLRRGVRRVTLSGMVGKMSKLAQGHMMTHVAGNQVDLGFLATVAAACGASVELQEAIRAANTARHFQELVLGAGLAGVFDHLAELVCRQCRAVVADALAVECLIFDFDSTILGRAAVA